MLPHDHTVYWAFEMMKRTAILCLAILILAVSTAVVIGLVPVLTENVVLESYDYAPATAFVHSFDLTPLELTLLDALLYRGPPTTLLRT